MKPFLIVMFATNALCLFAVIWVLTGHMLPIWSVYLLGAAVFGTYGWRLFLARR